MRHSRRRFFIGAALVALALPSRAWSCGGTGANDIAISSNGASYTVTDIGRVPVRVVFFAFGTTYSLSLAPGRSGTPSSGGLWSTPMKGYQSCDATAIAGR